MQIPPGGGYTGVPKRRLHQVDRRAAIERVRGMGVA